MTSPEDKQLSSTTNHCYEIDQKPPIFDQKPPIFDQKPPIFDQKPFVDFCAGSSNGDANNIPSLSSQSATPQPQASNLYAGYPTSAINGNAYFYPFGNMAYPTSNPTPQSASSFHYPQTSTSPESMQIQEKIFYNFTFLGFTADPQTKIIEGTEVHINSKGKKTRKPRTIYSSKPLLLKIGFNKFYHFVFKTNFFVYSNFVRKTFFTT